MLKQIFGGGTSREWHLLCLVTCCLSLVGCSSARRGEPVSGRPVSSAPRVRAGQVVFYQYCNPCHPGGEGGVGPALNNKPLPEFAIRTQVRHGLGAMPAF